MDLENLVVDPCVERMREQMGHPSREVFTADAGPALANAALLMAHGCLVRYATALRTMYATNNLPCPDLTDMFAMELPPPSVKTPSATLDCESHRVSTPMISVSIQTEPSKKTIFVARKNIERRNN